MCIDFSLLSVYTKAAIKCENRDEARELVEAMWTCYPEKMDPWWNDHGDSYEREYCDHYAPHIYDSFSDRLQVADEHYWTSHGYTIVPFHSLKLKPNDLGEFEIADNPFSMFYGG